MDAFLELFSLSGRANRARYIWHIILDDLVVAGMVGMLLFSSLITPLAFLPAPLIVLPAIGIGLAGAWAALAITVKRLHDLDRPGWHVLLFAVPLYNIYLSIVLFIVAGTRGDNEYGPDPLADLYGTRRQAAVRGA